MCTYIIYVYICIERERDICVGTTIKDDNSGRNHIVIHIII